MQPDTKPDETPELDPAKLFGFRNVARVTNAESDIEESADLAFTKRGTESFA